jgi:hypothetical protein
MGKTRIVQRAETFRSNLVTDEQLRALRLRAGRRARCIELRVD